MPDEKDIHPELTGATTSDTSFGRSAESQNQIADASVSSSSEGEALNIYRLEPSASAGDANWQNKPGHGIVVVAARTAGDARIVATGRELDFMEIDAAPADDVSTINASAFRDEKLYTVIEVERGRTDIERGVIEGNIRLDLIKPLQD
jgi:hypothetical protein